MRKIKLCAAAIALGLCLQIPAAGLSQVTVQAAEQKKGLVKVKKKYYYYSKGKKVKNRWVTVKVNGKKQRYYFGKNGAAYTGVKKIKKKTYYFNKKGQMQKNCWYRSGKKKQYYFNSKGTALTGICPVGKSLYWFESDGRLNQEKTKLLAQHTVAGADMESLKALIGEPEKAEYMASCMGPGDDGILQYQGFTIYTYREGAKETVQGFA